MTRHAGLIFLVGLIAIPPKCGNGHKIADDRYCRSASEGGIGQRKTDTCACRACANERIHCLFWTGSNGPVTSVDTRTDGNGGFRDDVVNIDCSAKESSPCRNLIAKDRDGTDNVQAYGQTFVRRCHP